MVEVTAGGQNVATKCRWPIGAELAWWWGRLPCLGTAQFAVWKWSYWTTWVSPSVGLR